MNRRSALQLAGIFALLLLVAFVLGRPDSDGPPLDPSSTGGLGTLGLVEFLERNGAQVSQGVPGNNSDVDVVLVLSDRLSGLARERLLDWIQDGGTAVIADPASPLLATGIVGAVAGDDLDRGACPIEELSDVQRLSAASLALLSPVPNSITCFGDSGGAYVIQFPDGEGTVTGLGGAVPLVNSQLDEEDNAVLVGRLLLQGDAPRIAVVYSALNEAGVGPSPADLIGRNVRWFGWQLVVATVIGLLWAIRRFGKVVPEGQVVELPGSLAVRATAELHRRSSTPERSAGVIRSALRDRVRADYRLPPEVDDDLAAAFVADHSGLDHRDAAVLTGAAAPPGADPVAQMQSLDFIARTVFGDFVESPGLPRLPSTPTPELTQIPEPEEPSNV